MQENTKGHVVLLMAPSGSGKNTVIRGLGALKDGLYFAKTYTSRQPREGVVENPKYVFISRDEFEKMIAEHAFIEWANFSGNYMGTPKSEFLEPLAEGKIVFKEMELQGVEQIKQLIPEDQVTVIYIDAGDWEELRKRIVGRAPITEEELEMRHQRYQEEVQFKPAADIVVSNRSGEIAEAQEHFREVITELMDSLKH